MLKHHNYENMNLWQILKTFSYYQKVNFALYCAKDVEPLANDPRVIDCNQVLQRWLNGDKIVDLKLARNNAWNAWRDSTRASASASCTAASAAYYTVSSAARADYAATSAVNAANAKSYNLYPNNNEQREIARTQFLNEYKQIAQNWVSYWNVPNFPKEELDFPLFDFLIDYNLISYLLPKKEDYYYLNLNGFDLKHHNEAELLKLIDTIHIKTILRRIINNDSSS